MEMLQRSNSEPNLDGKHGLPTAAYFTNGVPFITSQGPEVAYEFLRELGRGEYAHTYLVRRRNSGRELACKEIRKGSTPETVARAAREAEVHSSLSGHPNIAGLVEIWEDRKSYYMFMELCSGGELFHAISERGSLSEREAASVLKVVLQVIQHCHSNGVLHRDIKPENFMMKNQDGRLEKSNLLAIDFGCSCFLRPGERSFELAGSPMYLAPEAVAGRGYGYEADVWSAGVLLFSMLSGLSAFEGGSDEEVCWSVLHQPVDLNTEPWPFVSQEAKEVVTRLLERDPERRMTVEEALSCPWLHNLTAPSSQPLNLLVVDRMLHFVCLTPLQRLLLNLAISCSPPSHPRKHLRRLFNDLDTNGDGSLEEVEVATGLHAMGTLLPRKNIQEVMAALDIHKCGMIRIKQFLAGACDKRSKGVCSLLDKPSVQQRVVDGALSMTAFAELLDEEGMSMSISALAELISAQSIPIVGSAVCFADLEAHLRMCDPRFAGERPASPPAPLLKSALSEYLTRTTVQAQGSGVAADALGVTAVGKNEEQLDVIMEDLELEDPMEIRGFSPPPRGCSPDLSHPFFFHARNDEEKAGGLKHAGPVALEGSSPPSSESAWSKMLSERGRDRSPEFASSNSEGSMESRWKGLRVLGSSPSEESSMSSQEVFSSGGVMYWAGGGGVDEDLGCFNEEEEEDSDALFGAALTAREKSRDLE